MMNYPPSIKAHVVAVSDEFDLNGKPIPVYNVRVMKDFEGSTQPMTWNVVRSLKDFQENHTALKVNYGLLKKFDFKTRKLVNLVRRKSQADVNDDQVALYLQELVMLNPIPDEVISLLALENAKYAEKEHQRSLRRSRSRSNSAEAKKLLAEAAAAAALENAATVEVPAKMLEKSDSFSDFHIIEPGVHKSRSAEENSGGPTQVVVSAEGPITPTAGSVAVNPPVEQPGTPPPRPTTKPTDSAAHAEPSTPSTPSNAAAEATPEPQLRKRGNKKDVLSKFPRLKSVFSAAKHKKHAGGSAFSNASPSLSPQEVLRQCQDVVFYTMLVLLAFGVYAIGLGAVRAVFGLFYPSKIFGAALVTSSLFAQRTLSLARFLFQLGLLCLLAAYFHRLLGAAASTIVQSLLGTHTNPGWGKFNIEFKFVALRLGLDTNQIVIGNIIWHNTDKFRHTPCFISIEEIVVTLDMLSLYWLFVAPHLPGQGRELPNNFPIVINEVLINGVNVFVEKTANAKDGLNFFAALGAVNSTDEQSLQQYILSNMASAANSSKRVAKAVVKYNPASVLYRATTASGKHKKKGGAEEALQQKQAAAAEESEASDAESDSGDESDSDTSDTESDAPATPSTTASNVTKDSTAPHPAATAAASKPPIQLLIHKLIIFELLVHAQDFLNASHVDHGQAAPIHLVLLTMTDKELNRRNKKFSKSRERSLFNSERLGLKADDLVWRFLNKLSKELLRTNKMAIMQIMSGAALNQTTTAVFNLGSGLVSGVAGGAALGGSVVMSGGSAVKAGGKTVVNAASAGGNAVLGAASAGGSAVMGAAGGVLSGVSSGVTGVGKKIWGGSGDKK